MRHITVDLDERPRIDEQLDALAGGQLAARVLGIDPDLTAAEQRRLAPLPQPLDRLRHRGISTSSARTPPR